MLPTIGKTGELLKIDKYVKMFHNWYDSEKSMHAYISGF